jgi:hypothetical protein
MPVVAWRRPAPHTAVWTTVFAKRALQLAADYAEVRGQAGVTPEHLLYGCCGISTTRTVRTWDGVGAKHAQLGWTIGQPRGGLHQCRRRP